ncbi:MAG: hypothetical protein WCP57_04590 [Bacteroidota bacterium]
MKSFKSILILSILSISIFFISTLTSSCKKENKAPEIAILEPSNNDTITIASDPELHVEFTVSDDDALHYLSVKIKDASTTYFADTTTSVHDLKSYNYHEHYSFTGITTLTPVTVEISAEDHDEATTTKNIQVYVRP